MLQWPMLVSGHCFVVRPLTPFPIIGQPTLTLFSFPLERIEGTSCFPLPSPPELFSTTIVTAALPHPFRNGGRPSQSLTHSLTRSVRLSSVRFRCQSSSVIKWSAGEILRFAGLQGGPCLSLFTPFGISMLHQKRREMLQQLTWLYYP